MNTVGKLLGVLVLGLWLASPPLLHACPNCREAVADSGDDDDPQREARAYNESCYLFVSAPYLLLGAFGFMVYRASRQGRGLHLPPGDALATEERSDAPPTQSTPVRQPDPGSGNPG
jgi:hypothetical protein